MRLIFYFWQLHNTLFSLAISDIFTPNPTERVLFDVVAWENHDCYQLRCKFELAVWHSESFSEVGASWCLLVLFVINCVLCVDFKSKILYIWFFKSLFSMSFCHSTVLARVDYSKTCLYLHFPNKEPVIRRMSMFICFSVSCFVVFTYFADTTSPFVTFTKT